MNVATLGSITQLEIEQKIWEQLRLKIPREIIADSVLKFWSQNLLQPKAKNVAARFCLINGFRESLANTLIADLKSQKPIPWDICWELIGSVDLSKEALTHFLTGAARQNALEALVLQAAVDDIKDERFTKVANNHFDDLADRQSKQEQKLVYEFETVSKGAISAEGKKKIPS